MRRGVFDDCANDGAAARTSQAPLAISSARRFTVLGPLVEARIGGKSLDLGAHALKRSGPDRGKFQ